MSDNNVIGLQEYGHLNLDNDFIIIEDEMCAPVAYLNGDFCFVIIVVTCTILELGENY